MNTLRQNHAVNSLDSPLVSVVMIAYQLEDYIGEAIDSVLNQEVDFSVELVIGEDCSTDRTREICLAYQARYPNIIRVLEHSENLGLTPNCIATHNASNGKYLALLDGDDYWTSKLKLQIQINFLESHPVYSGSGHQSMKIFDNKLELDMPFGKFQDCDLILLDTISHRKFHTSSLVYRRGLWSKTGGIPSTISSNERAIYPMVASFGPIRYFGESMCVYRITGMGLTSRVDYKELETDFKMLPWLKKVNPRFPVSRFKAFLHLCCFTYGVKKLPLNVLMKHYIAFILYSFSYFPSNLGDLKWGTIFWFRALKN